MCSKKIVLLDEKNHRLCQMYISENVLKREKSSCIGDLSIVVSSPESVSFFLHIVHIGAHRNWLTTSSDSRHRIVGIEHKPCTIFLKCCYTMTVFSVFWTRIEKDIRHPSALSSLWREGHFGGFIGFKCCPSTGSSWRVGNPHFREIDSGSARTEGRSFTVTLGRR